MDELVLRLLVLARFLCFTALLYLGLHVIFSRLISKPESKVLWFFSVLTGPLTWPIRRWLSPGASESGLRSLALIFYGGLWLAILIVTGLLAGRLR